MSGPLAQTKEQERQKTEWRHAHACRHSTESEPDLLLPGVLSLANVVGNAVRTKPKNGVGYVSILDRQGAHQAAGIGDIEEGGLDLRVLLEQSEALRRRLGWGVAQVDGQPDVGIARADLKADRNV